MHDPVSSTTSWHGREKVQGRRVGKKGVSIKVQEENTEKKDKKKGTNQPIQNGLGLES